MKYVLFILLSLLVAFALVACGDDDDDDDSVATDDDDDDDDDDDNDDDDNDDDNDDDDDDNDTTPPLDCAGGLDHLYECEIAVPGDGSAFTASEALSDCQDNVVYDYATWGCILDCADQLAGDCSDWIDNMLCVPLCLFHSGPVPDDCVPAYPDARTCGHRGATLYAPENTIPAFEMAIEQGASMVEVDVRHTLDGYLVCMHDDTVDRTTDGTGRVEDMTLAEIQALTIDDSNYDDAYPELRIPTFAEALAAIDDGGVMVDIDAKTDRIDLVVQAVDDAAMTDRVVAYCGGQGEVDAYLAEDPDFPVMPGADTPDEVYFYLANYDLSYLEFTAASASPDAIAAVHAAGVIAFQDALGFGDLIFLLGSLEGWLDMLTNGIDIIQTDLPHVLTPFIDAVCE